VAHAYNPSYSGSRDQEDGSLKPEDPISKNPSHTQKGQVVWFMVQAEFKPQYAKQTNKTTHKTS
jgi:hypothetical protein